MKGCPPYTTLAEPPPGVMNGGSGAAWQIEQGATRLDIQHALFEAAPLAMPVGSTPRPLRGAAGRRLASEGKDLLLVGILWRQW